MDKERMEALKKLINGNDEIIEKMLGIKQDSEEGGEPVRGYAEKVHLVLQ